jgi:hypothetical protein
MSSVKETNLLGGGSYDLNVRLKDTLLVFPFKFKALLWKRGNRTFLLLGSMFEVKEFWNRKFDLSPSDSTLGRFWHDEVVHAFKLSGTGSDGSVGLRIRTKGREHFYPNYDCFFEANHKVAAENLTKESVKRFIAVLNLSERIDGDTLF